MTRRSHADRDQEALRAMVRVRPCWPSTVTVMLENMLCEVNAEGVWVDGWIELHVLRQLQLVVLRGYGVCSEHRGSTTRRETSSDNGAGAVDVEGAGGENGVSGGVAVDHCQYSPKLNQVQAHEAV
ncbi:hypothetical protein PF004_g32430, partial [Phytophthora fragariae]